MESVHISNSQYGGLYRGIVLNNTDPLNRGRMKVFVPAVYPIEFADGYDISKTGSSASGTSGTRLPWAEPSQPLFCGGLGENGMTQYPDVGTHVWVMFEAGNVHYPIVVGVIQQDKAKFENDKCIMHYGGMTVTFDKTTDTIYVDTKNIVITASSSVNVKGEDIVDVNSPKSVNIASDASVNIESDASVSVSSPDTVNISAPNGDCSLQNVSLVNHVHTEMSGEGVAPGSTKTKTAKESL